MPDVSGNSYRGVSLSEYGAAYPLVPAARPAYCHRRATRACGPSLLREPGAALYHLLSHPVPAIPAIAVSHSLWSLIRGIALVSRCGRALHGQYPDRGRAIGSPRLQQSCALAARRRYTVVPAASQGVPSAAATDRRLRWPAGDREEHRRLPADGHGPDRSSSSATARKGYVSKRSIRLRTSRVFASAKTWRRIWRLPTSWCFRVSPTPLDW